MTTVGGHKLDQLAINSTTAVAAEVRVNSALPATAVVEFMAKWFNLCPPTVRLSLSLTSLGDGKSPPFGYGKPGL